MKSILAATESDLHSVYHFLPTSMTVLPDIISSGR